MGWHPWGHAVIGIKVKRSQLLVQDKVRACDHPAMKLAATGEPANFCPVCGKPTFVDGMVWAEGYNTDKKTIGGFDVIVVDPDGSDPDCYIAAMGAARGYEYAGGRELLPLPMDTLDLAGIRARMAETLKPLGLWDETKFGLWAAVG